MSEPKQKEAVVILFNKGLRKIEYSGGVAEPQKKFTLPKSEAISLLKMFDFEVIEIGEGEDPSAVSARESALITDLRAEIVTLKAKIKELKGKNDPVDPVDPVDEVVEEDGAEEVDLEGMDRSQLEAFIKDNELEVRIQSNMKDDTVRNKIVEALK